MRETTGAKLVVAKLKGKLVEVLARDALLAAGGATG
jgi:hypothetical protein